MSEHGLEQKFLLHIQKIILAIGENGPQDFSTSIGTTRKKVLYILSIAAREYLCVYVQENCE